MAFILMACFLSLLPSSVALQSSALTHSYTSRQAGPTITYCNVTCAIFLEMDAICKGPHCGCAVPFLQAQGQCLVCKANTPRDAAAVQFLLDAEMSQCHKEGIKVAFHLELPPTAAAIVQKYDRDSASLRRFQTIFLALQIAGGHIGLVVVLAFGVFSRKVHRDPTCLNLYITWIFYSLVFSMLLYRGTDGNTVINSLGEVSPNLCLAQATFTNGARVMTACSTMTPVIQFWLYVRTATYNDSTFGVKPARWATCVLVVAPYILFIAFALPSALIGMDRFVAEGTVLEGIIPTNFYCSIIGTTMLQAMYGVSLAILIITMIFKVLIINVMFRCWRKFRHAQTKNPISLFMLLRIMVFGLYLVLAMVAYGATLHSPPMLNQDSPANGAAVPFHFTLPIWVDMLQATLPLAAFIVLGINSAMINSLMFWCRCPKKPPVHSVNTTDVNENNGAD